MYFINCCLNSCVEQSHKDCPKSSCWGTIQQQDNPFSYEIPAPPPGFWPLLGSGQVFPAVSFSYAGLATKLTLVAQPCCGVLLTADRSFSPLSRKPRGVKGSPFKAWSKSENSLMCPACCQEIFFYHFYLLGPFSSLFFFFFLFLSPNALLLLCLLWLTYISMWACRTK